MSSGATCVVLLGLAGALNAGAASLRLIVQDARSGAMLPGRIHLLDSTGKPVRPPGLPFWHDHFVCAGEVTLDLDPGRYRYTIERGPEWTMAPWFFDVAGAPVRPRLAEVESLVQRVRDEIERCAGVLPAEALAEYREALAAYEALRSRAVP